MIKDGRQTQDRRKVFIMTAILGTNSDTPLSYDSLMVDSEEAGLRDEQNGCIRRMAPSRTDLA